MKIVQMCARERTIDQFFLRSLSTKILRIIENLDRKEVRHMQKQCEVLERQTLMQKFLNH